LEAVVLAVEVLAAAEAAAAAAAVPAAVEDPVDQADTVDPRPSCSTCLAAAYRARQSKNHRHYSTTPSYQQP
jgi:hypothetical protein